MSSSKEVIIDSTLPKSETGVLDLLSQNPEADGRGVTIAVFDTGCDLAAAGLQTTSVGTPKYVDFLDCTGDGDVDISTAANVTDGSVKGLSGRTLTLGGSWLPEACTSVQLGAVPLYDLLPGSVKRRVQQEQKQKFQQVQHAKICQIQDEIAALEVNAKDNKNKLNATKTSLEQLQASMSEDYVSDAGPIMDIVAFKDTAKDVWRAVLDLKANGDLTDAVPMAPFAVERQIGTLGFGSAVTFCVQVYEDGKVLSIVTDAGSHGTHVAGIAAAHFETQDGSVDPKNGVAPGAQVLACKIGDGRVDSTETGTGLVRALIAAKKYNCDLINLSYGEPSWQANKGRVSQTFADAVYKWGMTVFTSAGNDGPALSTVGSPGALTAPITVGAYVSPSMMKEQYSTLPVTDEDTDASLQSTSYAFTSRGPTPDGCMPDICAPGGAIAPVPRHTLQGKSQKHGTSMASPNACGVAACVLSAIKQQLKETFGMDGLTINPVELKRALLNTAKSVDIADPFGQGMGLISAVDAVNYAMEHHDKQGQDTHFEVSVLGRGNSNSARGIYIRNAAELEGPMTFDIKVVPQFQHAIERTVEQLDTMVNLELDLQFKVVSYGGEENVDWITCPEQMTLLSATERGGQTFSLRIDPTKLPAPGAHFAMIQAVETKDPSRGALFHVPVTIIVPHNLEGVTNDDESSSVTVKEGSFGMDLDMPFHLKPGLPERRFLTVPQGAEFAILKIRKAKGGTNAGPHRIIVHSIPFAGTDIHNRLVESKRYLAVKEEDVGDAQEVKLRVRGGSTVEVCIQLSWLANPSPVALDTTLEFHSFDFKSSAMFATQTLRISSSSEYARTEIGAPLRTEMINPKATLKSVHRTIRPKKCDISTASADRDILPPSDAELQAAVDGAEKPKGTQIHQAHLEYEFEMDSADVSVTPRLASLFFQLYDSPIDSQLWVLKDSNGQVLQYAGAMHDASAISLKKGKYTVTVLLRHPERAVLDALKDVPLRLMMDLKGSNALDCSVYTDFDAASTPSVTSKEDGGLVSRKTVGKRTLKRGSYKALYVSRPTGKIPSWVQAGDVLTGSFQVDKDNGYAGMTLVYEMPPKPNKKAEDKDKSSSSSKDDKDTDKKDEETLEKAIFEAKLKHLKSLRSKEEAYTKLSDALEAEKPSDMGLRKELLEYVKSAKKPESVKISEAEWRAAELVQAVDGLTGADGPIDTAKLAQYFGCNQVEEDEEDNQDDSKSEEIKAAKELKKEMDDQRKTLRSALLMKTDALAKVFTDAKNATAPDVAAIEAAKENLNQALKESKVWVSGPSDLSGDDEKETYALAVAQAEIARGRPAAALAGLRKTWKDLSSSSKRRKEVGQEIVKLYRELGMEHWAVHWEESVQKQFPVASQKL